MAAEQDLIDAIRRGSPVLLPTDTVYGLCATPYREDAAQRAYRVKRRAETQPTALLAASLDMLLECLPELTDRDSKIARALLPGPYTLVLRNPARRYPWLTGARPDTIGVRVADLPAATQRVLDAVGCVLATSANEPGDPAPARLDQIPDSIRAACEAELDAGELPGLPSTVLDFSASEPVVIREGAAPVDEALARVRTALAG